MSDTSDTWYGPQVGRFFLPGDVIGSVPSDSDQPGHKALGPGLMANRDVVSAIKAGVLSETNDRILWVDTEKERYVASVGDVVIGAIVSGHADVYRVDVGAHVPAGLPTLAFEGATKRNRPQLKAGDIVYCRVTIADKDMEAELSCVTAANKAQGLGQLKDGFLFRVSTRHARTLLSPDCHVLNQLGQHMAFEIAVGVNGRVWVNAATTRDMVFVSNAIVLSENKKDSEITGLLRVLLSRQ